MSPNPTWLGWAQRIQSIAQAGLTYSSDPYDQERFQQLRQIATEIFSSHMPLPDETVAAAIDREDGYLTPKVDVRAAVFDADGRILLVRERAEGLWSLPGGFADVGESASEAAAREVLEESGFCVRPVKVLAVQDRAKHPHPPMLWYVYKLLFRCELLGGEPRESLETSGAAFFERGNFPPLSLSRVTEAQLERIFAHFDDPDLPTDFD